MKEEYIKLFIDKDYPEFIDKYLNTKTLNRLKHISQFCGCDYTKLYSPLFFYSRFDHSLVVAHMTWHFTHNKKETIVALLHDIGTPCFAHTIDYVFGDYINQESSEKDIREIIKKDEELYRYLEEDGITLEDFADLSCYPILENKSPKLCTDRLDGVLGTVYIWLHSHPKEAVKKVYDAIEILKNEEEKEELGFCDKESSLAFVEQVFVYAKELQCNRNKFTMKYISDVVKEAVGKRLITMDDLYTKEESEMLEVFSSMPTWETFANAEATLGADSKPDCYFVSLESKRRNVIPLIQIENNIKRVDEALEEAKEIYNDYNEYHSSKYVYVKGIKKIN